MSDLEALKEATRDAHAAIKDLRAATKEAKQVIADIDRAVQTSYEEQIDEAVRIGLDAYKDAVTTAIEHATTAVYERFDRLSAMLLGEHERNRRRGDLTMREMVEQVVQERNAL